LQKIFPLAIWLCWTFAANASPLPNPWTTPGAINPQVTEKVICAKGFSTKRIRPPLSYTSKLKRQQMAAAHLKGKPAAYEEDHLISLELGGHPTDPGNLWPELWNGRCGAHTKDRLEDRLHKLVCAGKVPLSTAQSEIASNWVMAYNQYVGPLSCPMLNR
jgi:hypothetical protein